MFYSSNYFPLCPASPSPLPTFTVSPYPFVHVHGSFIYIPWLIPSPSFKPSPLPSCPLTAVLFWFYFVDSFIFSIRFLLCEIKWYLSFTNWLISINTIVSNSSSAAFEVCLQPSFPEQSLWRGQYSLEWMNSAGFD